VFKQLLLSMPEPVARRFVVGLLLVIVIAAIVLGVAFLEPDPRPPVPFDAHDEARARRLRAMQEVRRG
jgi:hypothetical protein